MVQWTAIGVPSPICIKNHVGFDEMVVSRRHKGHGQRAGVERIAIDGFATS